MNTRFKSSATAMLGAVAMLAATIAGCSKGTDRAEVTDTPPSATSTPPSRTPVQTVEVDRSAYWGGLRFDVGSVAYTPGPHGGYKIVVNTTVTNTLKTAAIRSWPSLSLDLDGSPLTGDVGTAVPPAPGDANPLSIVFKGTARSGPAFVFDDAALVLGKAGLAQAVVPLGRGGPQAVTLKPLEVPTPPSGSVLTSGRLTLNLKSVQLRADYGNGGGTTVLRRGQRALLVVFDMEGHVGPPGMVVDGSLFRLRLPNGQEIGPTEAPIEALYPNRPTRQNQAAWFILEGATDGSYAFTVTDPGKVSAISSLSLTGIKDSGPVS
ncbi:hypothetical protein ACIGBL_34470 [Streptomyces sp. NPDC085614]|uniref:hypothetical protein n=1 Tax=Streptomyces sp. NPDC085614 TaxID=3365733 RepID=UPI0037D59DB4